MGGPSLNNLLKEYVDNIPVLPSQNKSVPTRIVEMNGVKYQEYKHPLFGTSLIKIED